MVLGGFVEEQPHVVLGGVARGASHDRVVEGPPPDVEERGPALGRGGRGYQVLAVFLTYMSISSTYLPVIFKSFAEARKGKTTAAAQVDPAPKPAGEPSHMVAKPKGRRR